MIGAKLRVVALASAVLGSALALGTGRAAAETGELRVAMQYGLQYMPLLMMQHEGLIEKHVVAAGLPRPKVSWYTFSGGDVLVQALLAGQVDISNGSLIAFTSLWSKTQGANAVKAIAPFNRVPVVLLTRNPNVKTVKDFTDSDRIAVPAVKVSGQALILEMAAEKAFGPGHWEQLDHLTVAMALPDGYAALSNPKSEVNSHFANPPVIELEKKLPGVHVVLTERDVLGGDTYSGGVSFASQKFISENPKTAQAYFDAMKEAMAMIDQDKDKIATAKVYLEMTHDKTPVENIAGQLSSGETVYNVVPLNIGTIANFMNHIDMIKRKPDSWKDLFFPYVYDLKGS